MSISGYGLTLVGASLGAFAGAQSVNVGGIEVNFDEIITVDQTDRITESLALAVREGPMEVVFNWNKTLHQTLRNACKAITEDTFTLTDSENSIHAGLGWVAKVGGRNLDPQGHSIFNVTLKPKKAWDFTPGT
jgi:hypothetical protein